MSKIAKRKQKTARPPQAKTRSTKLASPKSDTATKAAPPRQHTKIETLLVLLQRNEGTNLKEMVKATGWQTHSVRGALSGTIKKKLGLKVVSVKSDGVRRYSIKA